MNTLLQRIKSERLYFDGGLGTMLQAKGLAGGEAPEDWNLSHPQEVMDVHRQYLEAGCDIITTNTFGINRSKQQNWRELIEAAMDIAKKAVSGFEGRYIAFDIGPTGRLMAPLGDLDFEEAVAIYSDNIRLAARLGADLIIIETMNDCHETKAAVIAAKESCKLPVIVSNAYDRQGKLMTGASVAAMVAILEGLRVDAFGLNCSFGPDVALEIVDEFAAVSSTPIIAMPNAGLPRVENGSTVYDVSAEEFSEYMVSLAKKGVSILGGCCGTTPEFIKKTIEKTKDIPVKPISQKHLTVVSSYTHAVRIDDQPILIGERINPTGKPRLKEALRSENMGYIIGEAAAQADAGAHILDVNVGLPEIDEVKMLKSTVVAVQSVTDLPLQLDTANPAALEQALRIYNGKPLINSVNGEPESMAKVFPLARKYGGAIIALTMDKQGIPTTAQGRVDIAKRIIETAKEYGIDSCDIIVDPLCLTVSSDSKSAFVTLEAVRIMHGMGIKTSLGVSNISFGLPEREKINTAFFACALENGLNCAIMNPRSAAMMDVYYAFRALHDLDTACSDYIAHTSQSGDTPAQSTTVSVDITLAQAIVKGLKDKSAELARELLKTAEPLSVINEHIIPALNDIGGQFERHKAFLPQLLMSADAATAAFAEVKAVIPKESADDSGRFIIATVKGDIHDIGKNIVRVMLESYGFTVYDLGRDVEPQRVLDKVIETGCKLVGLSALMTTTVPSMEATIKLLKDYDPQITTVVGGAVLNQEYADMIGADFYAKDAMDTVRFAQKYYGK